MGYLLSIPWNCVESTNFVTKTEWRRTKSSTFRVSTLVNSLWMLRSACWFVEQNRSMKFIEVLWHRLNMRRRVPYHAVISTWSGSDMPAGCVVSLFYPRDLWPATRPCLCWSLIGGVVFTRWRALLSLSRCNSMRRPCRATRGWPSTGHINDCTSQRSTEVISLPPLSSHPLYSPPLPFTDNRHSWKPAKCVEESCKLAYSG